MTEEEWLHCKIPQPMMRVLRGRASLRRLRLLTVDCFRRHWEEIQELETRRRIEVIEGYADGHISDSVFTSAFADHSFVPDRGKTLAQMIAIKVHHSRWRETDSRSGWELGEYEEDQTRSVLIEVATSVAINPNQEFDDALFTQETLAQANLIRDIFGNPFRAISVLPEWRIPTTQNLAQSMYDTRDFGVMPLLADALEEAGCDNEEILAHCRGAGPHVRGCWVVDLVLNKG